MQQERLTQLENIIAGNQRRFYEIGKALKEIKDSRLYKLSFYTTFEKYVRARWDIGRSQAYRLIDAYNVVGNLSPIGDIILPSNENQTRPLRKLDSTEQRKIWKDFLDTGMDINTRNIKQFIDERKVKEESKPVDRTGQISSEYMNAVQEMLTQVRFAQNNHWQKTSRQAALLWNRVIQEKIISREANSGDYPDT